MGWLALELVWSSAGWMDLPRTTSDDENGSRLTVIRAVVIFWGLFFLLLFWPPVLTSATAPHHLTWSWAGSPFTRRSTTRVPVPTTHTTPHRKPPRRDDVAWRHCSN